MENFLQYISNPDWWVSAIFLGISIIVLLFIILKLSNKLGLDLWKIWTERSPRSKTKKDKLIANLRNNEKRLEAYRKKEIRNLMRSILYAIMVVIFMILGSNIYLENMNKDFKNISLFLALIFMIASGINFFNSDRRRLIIKEVDSKLFDSSEN